MSERSDVLLKKLADRLLEIAPDYPNANTRDAIRAVAHAIENALHENNVTLRDTVMQRRRTMQFNRRMP